MKKVNLLLALTVLCFAFSITSCRKSKNSDKTETITVGSLLSLTGNWSTLGITSKAAMEMAVDDINQYMEQTGSKYRFAVTIYDTKLDPALATQFIATAKNEGYNFIVGPQSSAEAAAVRSFADSNDMLVVSQGSTAGSLSIANDNLFRFCPDDRLEGAAIAKTIYNSGIKGLVILGRDDAGNNGLQNSVDSVYTLLGGHVASNPSYPVTTTDFTAVLASIKTQIQAFIAQYGASGTGVYLASFDEGAALFQQAAADPFFSSVHWYGGDGVVSSAAFTSNAAAADFAIATNFFAPTYGLPQQAASKWQPVALEIKSRTGLDADAFALASYDALWVLARTYAALPADEPTFSDLKSNFKEQADMFYGLTGATLLNAAGDRAIGSFDYWGLENQNGSYRWVLKGRSE